MWLANWYRALLQFSTPLPGRVHWSEPTDVEKRSLGEILFVLRADEAGAPPLPEDTWTLWHADLFDRECPPNIEAKGEGLKRGLVELWITHLHEGLGGLSSFSLSWKGRRGYIEIVSKDKDCLQKFRAWVFPTKEKDQRVERKHADFSCLVGLAACHARLIQRGQTIEPILDLVRSASDAPGLLRALAEIPARVTASYANLPSGG